MRATMSLVLVGLSAMLVAACGGGAGGMDFAPSKTPIPAETTAELAHPTVPPGTDSMAPPPAPGPDEVAPAITNPYLPFTPGVTYVHEGQTRDGFVRIETRVLHETRLVLDLPCTVVVVDEQVDGEQKEQTVDYYVQDAVGNVWYMGEEVQNYEHGVVVDTEGSWMAGVDGAAPGIAMPADPEPGTRMIQESLPGVAEDQAEVIAVAVPVTLADGSEHVCLQTKEWSPLDPEEVEYKYYAPGTGLVKETRIDGSDAVELVDRTED